jgi:hypothetical protein
MKYIPEHLWGFKGHCSFASLGAWLYKVLLLCVSGIVRTETIITCKEKWPKQESLIPGQKNAVNTPLINPEKVYLPLLHIKLGHTKKLRQCHGSK